MPGGVGEQPRGGGRYRRIRSMPIALCQGLPLAVEQLDIADLGLRCERVDRRLQCLGVLGEYRILAVARRYLRQAHAVLQELFAVPRDLAQHDQDGNACRSEQDQSYAQKVELG